MFHVSEEPMHLFSSTRSEASDNNHSQFIQESLPLSPMSRSLLAQIRQDDESNEIELSSHHSTRGEGERTREYKCENCLLEKSSRFPRIWQRAAPTTHAAHNVLTAFEKFIQSVSYLAWQSGVFSAHPLRFVNIRWRIRSHQFLTLSLRLWWALFIPAVTFSRRGSLEISRISTTRPNYQFGERVFDVVVCVFARQKKPVPSLLFSLAASQRFWSSLY